MHIALLTITGEAFPNDIVMPFKSVEGAKAGAQKFCDSVAEVKCVLKWRKMAAQVTCATDKDEGMDYTVAIVEVGE